MTLMFLLRLCQRPFAVLETREDAFLAQSVEGQRVVLSGLAAGERVIVDGTQHVMPGALVEAQNVSGKVTAR